jgi:hypothetical protein
MMELSFSWLPPVKKTALTFASDRQDQNHVLGRDSLGAAK